MKKLLALLLAAMMLLSLAACGGGDDTPSGNEDNPPSSGQQQEQNTPDPDEGVDEPDNSGGGDETPDDGGEESIEWPSELSSIQWTGTGEIDGFSGGNQTGTTLNAINPETDDEVTIWIRTATLDEVGEYIEKLKGLGFEYSGRDDEPALAFDDGIYRWYGKPEMNSPGQITIELREEQKEGMFATYQLQIQLVDWDKYD